MSRKYRQKAHGVAAFNAVYSANKFGAKQRGINWCLTKTQFSLLISQSCYYCGSPPSNTSHKAGGDCIYSGIDRVINENGYTVENSVPCCKICNRAKSEMTQAEFFEHIKRIVKHLELT